MSRFLICLILGALSGVAAPPAKTTSPSTARPAPSSDIPIEGAIKAKLARSKIGKDPIKVRVQNGIAYWEGSTDVLQHKGAATRMAKSAGASRVVNNIQVSAEGRAKARAHLEQGRRNMQVKRSEARGEQRSAPRAAVIRR